MWLHVSFSSTLNIDLSIRKLQAEAEAAAAEAMRQMILAEQAMEDCQNNKLKK